MYISLLVLPTILFLCLCFSAHGLHQSILHHTKINPKQHNLIRRLKGLSALAYNNNNKPYFNETVFNYRDNVYYMDITIGSNRQPFRVLPDTGSSLFWVVDSSCSSANCRKRHQFYSQSSVSYKPTTWPFTIKYGTGSSRGFYGIDTVGFGNPPVFSVPQCVIGQATELDPHFEHSPEFEGIFGLSYGATDDDRVDSPLRTAVKQGIFARNLFTVFLQINGPFTEGQQGGVITWGEIDSINCAKEVYYVPLVPYHIFWAFEVQAVCYGQYCDRQTRLAITDTGSNGIFGPRGAIKGLLAQMGLELDDNGNDHDLRISQCNDQIELIGTIDFVIGGYKFQVPKELFIKDLRREIAGVCSCRLAPLPIDDDKIWILGVPFIQQFCQIHDFDNKQIGFAVAKQTNKA